MLEAYFDDSGTHNNSRVSVWAGFVGDTDQWKALDTDWRKLLKHPDFNLSHFHMYNVVHGDGECDRWEQGRRDNCIYEFREIIIRHGLHGIGSSIPKKDWEDIAIPSKLFSYPADQFGLSASIANTRHYTAFKDEKITFIFDDRQRQQPAVDSAIKFYMNDAKKPKVLGASFQNMRDFTGLQAADMLAWETYQYSLGYLEEGAYPDASAHFQHFLDRTPLNGEFYRRERIQKLVDHAIPMPEAAIQASKSTEAG